VKGVFRKTLSALTALLVLSACQGTPKDDPLVIRDDDTLAEFMLPASRDMVWTYRRETVGLIEEVATISIAVETLKKDSATLAYSQEGGESPEIVQGIGIRGDAAIALSPEGAVTWKDELDERTYTPDGRVTSKGGTEFELVGTETIRTAAGTFACVKYRVHREPSIADPMTLEGTQWWGKGVGLVKAVSTVEGFKAGTRTTIELITLER
jgi:hypothetical protein